MVVGLEALRIFESRSDIETHKNHPSIYREGIDKSCPYNPNNDYLRALPKEDRINRTSPWYCFTLIPNTTIEGTSSLDASLYLMQFLNWAVYYYSVLASKYSEIPKGRTKKADVIGSQKRSKFLADLITIFSIRPEMLRWSTTPVTLTLRDFEYQRREFSMRTFTEEAVNIDAARKFRRNKFLLKPSYFLKLCRFFARAWYEERFCEADDAVGSVEFAHYVSNYIEASLVEDYSYIGKRYNGNNENTKKEVARLFSEETNIEYPYQHFHIQLEKIDNLTTEEESSYTISISQYKCRHTFYLFARLYQYRYQSPIK